MLTFHFLSSGVDFDGRNFHPFAHSRRRPDLDISAVRVGRGRIGSLDGCVPVPWGLDVEGSTLKEHEEVVHI